MTANKWDSVAWGGGPVPDVVVALFPAASATAVARAAVREASARGARLKFVQVSGPGAECGQDGQDGSHDEVTFAAALRAMREHPRLPVTFEALEYTERLGDELVGRSGNAAVLVLGTSSDVEHRLAAHCQRHARCDVLLVRDPLPKAGGDAEVTARTS